MDPLSQRLMMGAAGGGPPVYIEDVFSTWLYTGNGGTQTITNGIDLAGKGGLVWGKSLNDGTNSHRLQDTVRGVGNEFFTNLTNAQNVGVIGISSFNSNGFTLGSGINNWTSNNGRFVTWTFRKQPKFFDIVTYTGTGASSQIVSHSLGVAPACIIIKKTSAAQNWRVYTRKSDTVWSSLYLNLTSAGSDFNYSSISPALTSTTIDFGYISTNIEAFNNDNGATYVAYLFAHNAGGFGATGTDNVISCGSYTGNGSTLEVNLGYEAQWVFVKRINDNGDWWCADIMRGMTVGTTDSAISLNSINNENTSVSWIEPRSNGFALTNASVVQTNDVNGLNSSYIYIAIRRGPMRTPTVGTSVYHGDWVQDTNNQVVTNFPVDLVWNRYGYWNDFQVPISGSVYVYDRLRGSPPNLVTSTTAAETTSQPQFFVTTTGFQSNIGLGIGPGNGTLNNYYAMIWNFRRAPSFLDVVCYSGAAFIPLTVNHNLGVAPELIIIKKRSGLDNWMVYTPLVPGKSTLLNSDSGTGTDSSYPTSISSTSITLPYSGSINVNGSTFVAYLFASCPGVSKVGTYTGTGSTLQVNCGFTTGARFVLIRRVDGNLGSWYIWDVRRGIIAGNDPYLLLNSTAAGVTNTDWIDPISSGFEVSNAGSNLVNVNGGTYLFLAIA